jgi:hypothetical protein
MVRLISENFISGSALDQKKGIAEAQTRPYCFAKLGIKEKGYEFSFFGR